MYDVHHAKNRMNGLYLHQSEAPFFKRCGLNSPHTTSELRAEKEVHITIPLYFLPNMILIIVEPIRLSIPDFVVGTPVVFVKFLFA